MKGTIRGSLLDKYLDPASSLGEILFGLIMTLPSRSPQASWSAKRDAPVRASS